MQYFYTVKYWTKHSLTSCFCFCVLPIFVYLLFSISSFHFLVSLPFIFVCSYPFIYFLVSISFTPCVFIFFLLSSVPCLLFCVYLVLSVLVLLSLSLSHSLSLYIYIIVYNFPSLSLYILPFPFLKFMFSICFTTGYNKDNWARHVC